MREFPHWKNALLRQIEVVEATPSESPGVPGKPENHWAATPRPFFVLPVSIKTGVNSSNQRENRGQFHQVCNGTVLG